MKIRKIRAKNFLSFGEDGIEIDFEKLNNIVLIKGQNLDIGPNSSNASGKSSLIEVITYSLYGKVVKGLAHKEIVNKKTKKNCEVQIEFDNYLIIRRRKPDSLEIYEDGKNITPGGILAAQALIESIIRLNYEAFINVVCFGEHNNHAFLSCDAATKRSIIENLLGLEKYVKYCKSAKDQKNLLENEHTIQLKKYEAYMINQTSIIEQLSKIRERQKQWILNKKQEALNIDNQIAKYREELSKQDGGSELAYFQECQTKISKLNEEVTQYEIKRGELLKIMNVIQDKINSSMTKKYDLQVKQKDFDIEVDRINNKIKEIKVENEHFGKLHNEVKCTRCRGVINKENYHDILLQNRNQILHYEEEKAILSREKNFNGEIAKTDELLNNMKEKKVTGTNKIDAINRRVNDGKLEIQKLMQVKKPVEIETKVELLNDRILELEKSLDQKLKELQNSDPYKEIMDNAEEERVKVEAQMKKIKESMDDIGKLIPYYEYWITGFGDEGIRAFIIDGILPALNARINYWLQFLVDNKIQVKFDKFFEAVIERNPPDGDPFVYSATSGGERRRINLANSQAFAYITMLSSQQMPSLISLDEVALNVDSQGIDGIYRMICELARERQVLVTTHDTYLTDLLSNCDEIMVQKKDGFSSVVKCGQ